MNIFKEGDNVVTLVELPNSSDERTLEKFNNEFHTNMIKKNMWGTVTEVGDVYITVVLPFVLILEDTEEEYPITVYALESQIGYQSLFGR